jgi:N-acylglucosamine-6-phosphate 2-epimerase
LIVSVQAESNSLLNTPETIALLARCAEANGAVGVRIEGEARIAAVRAALPDTPIVGIIKRPHAGFEPYITSTCEEVARVARAGATIVAFDATARERADGSSLGDLVARARESGLLAMADSSEPSDAAAASAAGADLVATTLAGYTESTRGRALPALDLLAEIVRMGAFAVCEGGIATPEHVRAAFDAGAGAVVVGTAITNVDVLVRRFATATPRAVG